ncbi:MAG: hypothetical protein AB1831_02655 [Pseudomonadota bacterium]
MMLLMAAPAVAGPSCESDQTGPRVRLVRQADGSVVERLAMASAPQLSSDTGHVPEGGVERAARGGLPGQVEGLMEFLDSILEPRAMTALATVPVAGDAQGALLSNWVDPSLVRNWAEFVDPALALRWKMLIAGKGFSQAVMLRGEDASRSEVHSLGRPGQGGGQVATTWRNAVSEGAKRSLNGQQALREWLVLPMPDPKANPWLSNLAGYRY